MKNVFIRMFLVMTIVIMTMATSIVTIYGVNISNVSKVTSVKIVKKPDKVVFKWKKVKKAKGYQIKVTKDKDFKKELLKITVTKNKNKYVYKKLKTFTKGKKYYIKVRAYKKTNGIKKYGKWSKIKNFKIKEKNNSTGYWCDDGGTHHSFSDNTIGWYNTAIEAEKKARELKQYTHYQLEQCDFCGKWTAILW